MIAFLYIVSHIIWIYIIFKLPKWLKLPFYPTDAAFSFPFVVSAIASLEAMMFSMKQGFDISAWNTPIVIIQTIVALILTLLTIYRFSKFIFEDLTSKKKSNMGMNMMNKAREMN